MLLIVALAQALAFLPAVIADEPVTNSTSGISGTSGCFEPDQGTAPLDRHINLPYVGNPALTTCQQWGKIEAAGGFKLSNDLWNIEHGSGKQCSTMVAAASPMSWYTTYDWTPRGAIANQVLSYSNMWTQYSPQALLVKISKIKTSVVAEYAGTDVIANVAYDLFISHPHRETIEVMVQLGAYDGSKPISSTGRPVAYLQLSGHSWYLYKGRNDYAKNDVYSFVASNAALAVDINVSLDLKLFLHYLMAHYAISKDYYLQSVGFGSEVFRGVGQFYVKSYTLNVVNK